MKKNELPKVDIGMALLITGSGSNVPLWIGVFVSSEGNGPVVNWIRNSVLPVFNSLAGLTMALTVAVGLVYVLGRLSKLQPTTVRADRSAKGKKKGARVSTPNPRFWIAAGSIVALFIVSLILLSPYEYQLIGGQGTLFEVLGSNWAKAWAVARVLAADVALAAVAAVHGPIAMGESAPLSKPLTKAGSKSSDGSEQASSPAQQTSKSAQRDGQQTSKRSKSAQSAPAEASKPLSDYKCKYEVAGCSKTFTSQGAANAHSSRCSYNPKNGIRFEGSAFDQKRATTTQETRHESN